MDLRAPFTVTLFINADGSARGAGLTETTSALAGVRNYAQLIVARDGELIAFDEIRLTAAGQENAELSVRLTTGRTYDFLLLLGHKEHSGYSYNEAVPPTLLAAGLLSQEIITGENTVTIPMNPLVADTKFTTGAETVEALTGGVSLKPGDWNLEWAVSSGDSETSGFTTLLAAQEKIRGSRDINTLFKNKTAVMGGTRWETKDIAVDGKKVTLNIGELAGGETGSYNFNLDYVPFSVHESAR
jgi:hypothetical protein